MGDYASTHVKSDAEAIREIACHVILTMMMCGYATKPPQKPKSCIWARELAGVRPEPMYQV